MKWVVTCSVKNGQHSSIVCHRTMVFKLFTLADQSRIGKIFMHRGEGERNKNIRVINIRYTVKENQNHKITKECHYFLPFFLRNVLYRGRTTTSRCCK